MMKVKAELKDAFRFSVFDEDSNTFKVHGYMVQPEDVGTYKIIIRARFFNENHEENFENSFLLTIWDDPWVPPEPWFPEDPIEYPEWDGYIREDEKLGEFHPDQPVPYIADIT